MKQNFEIYPPGCTVWYVSRLKDNTPYVAIFEAIVESINITNSDLINDDVIVEYKMMGVSNKISEEWVSTSYDDLCQKMKLEWSLRMQDVNSGFGITNDEIG